MQMRTLKSFWLAASLVALWGAAAVAPLMSAPVRRGVIAIFPDSGRLATTSSDGLLQVWSADGQTQIKSVQVDKGRLISIAIAPDGKRLAAGSGDKSISIWDTNTWREIHMLTGHDGPVLNLAFSPDGKRLASTSADKTVRLWDTDSGAEVAVLRGHTARVTGVAFSPNGALLASVADDASPRVWDTVSGNEVATFEFPDKRDIAQALTFTRDSCCLVVSGRFAAFAWDIKSRALKYKMGTAAKAGLAHLPDGKRLVGAAQHAVFLYDAATGKVQSSYSPSDIERPSGSSYSEFGDILALALSPDGQSFALASAWGGIHVARIAAIDAQQARSDAEYDEPRKPLCLGEPCVSLKWTSQAGCVALTNATSKIMSLDVAYIGGGRYLFAIRPGETQQLKLMVDCVKSIGDLKSVDVAYITEAELPRPKAADRPKAPTSPAVTIPPAPTGVGGRKTENASAATSAEQEWTLCSSSGTWSEANDACTRLIARGAAVSGLRRAEAFLKRAKLNERRLSLSKPDRSVQANMLADYGESIRLNPQQPLVYLARAGLAGRMGDRKLAVADYSEVVRLDPRNSAAYRGRGGIYLTLDDLDRAIADFTKSIELEPDSVAYELRARAYEKKSDLKAAFADLDAALGRSPKNSFIAEVVQSERDRVGRPLAADLAARGQLARQSGDIDRAFADFTEALRFDSSNWRANLGRGSIHVQRADLEKAEADVRRAIQKFSRTKLAEQPPEIIMAHVLLGEVYEKRSRFRDALLEYDEALKAEQEPSSADSIRAGKERVKQAAWKRCADSARRDAAYSCMEFLTMGNDVEAALRAKAFLKAGQSAQLETTGDPRSSFDHAIRLDNQQPLAFFGRAQSNASRGALDNALADFTESIRLDPKFAPAFYGRGLVHEKRGDLDKALEDLTQAIKLGNLMEAYALRSDIYQRKGDASRSAADLAAAIEAAKSSTGYIDPAEPFACLGRAQLAVAQGKFDEAGRWFSEATRRDLKNALAYLGRGALYVKQDRVDEAMRELSDAIRFGKLDLAFALRGQLFEKKGDLKRALADYDAVLSGSTNVANAEGIRVHADRIRSQGK